MLWIQFFDNNSTIFVRIWKIISPLKSAIFQCRTGSMKKIFQTQFLGLGSPIWGCWYLVSWDPKRHTFSVYTFHRYNWFAVKLFHPGYAQDTRNAAVFLLWLHPLGYFQNVLWQQSPLYTDFMGLPLTQWRSAVHNWTYSTMLSITNEKMKSLTFGLDRPTHRSGSNWTHKCLPSNNRFVPKFIQISRRLGKRRTKNRFLGRNRAAQPCQCMGIADNKRLAQRSTTCNWHTYWPVTCASTTQTCICAKGGHFKRMF